MCRSKFRTEKDQNYQEVDVSVGWEVGFKLKYKEILLCHFKAGPYPILKEVIPDK